nr:MAG TPA_asm: hypothetical protein [Caudoviricetes sp.]
MQQWCIQGSPSFQRFRACMQCMHLFFGNFLTVVDVLLGSLLSLYFFRSLEKRGAYTAYKPKNVGTTGFLVCSLGAYTVHTSAYTRAKMCSKSQNRSLSPPARVTKKPCCVAEVRPE